MASNFEAIISPVFWAAIAVAIAVISDTTVYCRAKTAAVLDANLRKMRIINC